MRKNRDKMGGGIEVVVKDGKHGMN